MNYRLAFPLLFALTALGGMWTTSSLVLLLILTGVFVISMVITLRRFIS